MVAAGAVPQWPPACADCTPAFSQIWSVISVVNLVLIWYTENGRRDDGYGNRGGRIVEGCLMFELSDHYMKRVRETL